MTSRYIVPFEYLDAVLVAIEKVRDAFPTFFDVSMFVGHDLHGYSEKMIALCGDTLADNKEEATTSLKILHHLPPVPNAVNQSSFIECNVKQLLQRFADLLDSAGKTLRSR